MSPVGEMGSPPALSHWGRGRGGEGTRPTGRPFSLGGVDTSCGEPRQVGIAGPKPRSQTLCVVYDDALGDRTPEGEKQGC